MATPAPRARAALWRDLLAALLLFALTMAVMGPIVRAPRTTIIGWAGDNIQYVYAVGWSAQALLLGRSPFVDPRMNYPDDLYLATTDMPYLSQVAVAPATWLLGPVFGYNLIIGLSFFLSGLFAYLWVCRLTGSRLGGLVAGAIFLLTPYRLAHSFGHLQLTATFALPLLFWALDSFLHAPRARPWGWLALAGAAALLGGSAQYYLVIGAIGAAAYTLLSLRASDWRGWLRRSSMAAAAVAVGALLSATPYLLAAGSRSFVPYDIMQTRIWSASPANFLLPSPYHPLWGELIARLRPEPLWIEKALYLSVVGLVLSGVALTLGRRQLAGRGPAWVGVALAGAVLALGTDLHLANQPVQPVAPLWLPAYYLSGLPGVELMRVWARFGVLTVLFVALLAGVGAAELLRRAPAWRPVLGAVLLALVLIDLAPGALPTATLTPRAVDQWLAAQPATVVAAALPANLDGSNYRTLFGSIYHARHMPAYMHPAHLPPAYRDFAARAADFPAHQSLVALRDLGIDYLLLDRQLFDGSRWPDWPAISAGLASADVPIVAELDGIVIVDLRGLGQ